MPRPNPEFSRQLLGFTKRRHSRKKTKAGDLLGESVLLGRTRHSVLDGSTGVVQGVNLLSKSYDVTLDSSGGKIHVERSQVFLVFNVDSAIAEAGGEFDRNTRRRDTADVADRDGDTNYDHQREANSAPFDIRHDFFADSCSNCIESSSGAAIQDLAGRASFYSSINSASASVSSLMKFAHGAEQGDAVSQNALGALYAEGLVCIRDDAEAVRLFQLAADQGDPRGQTNLGTMYAKGLGLRRNPSKAVRLYQLAAKQGYGPANTLLSAMYSEARF